MSAMDPDDQLDIQRADDVIANAGCACVHHDAHECARIRDSRYGFHSDPDQSVEVLRRACECSCHEKEIDFEEFDHA